MNTESKVSQANQEPRTCKLCHQQLPLDEIEMEALMPLAAEWLRLAVFTSITSLISGYALSNLWDLYAVQVFHLTPIGAARITGLVTAVLAVYAAIRKSYAAYENTVVLTVELSLALLISVWLIGRLS